MAVTSTQSLRDLDQPPQSHSLVTIICRAAADPAQRLGLVCGLICLGMFLQIFWDNLGHFYYAWTTDENYSHGFLVPLSASISPTALHPRGRSGRRRRLVREACCSSYHSLCGSYDSIADPLLERCRITHRARGAFHHDDGCEVSEALLVRVLLPDIHGPASNRARIRKIASPLQLFASRVASTLMTATGLPVLCEGNKMTLPGGLQMFVAEACSGMRQLTGFLALTAAVAYWTKGPPWYRTVILISALPIALSANIARVMLTGYIMHFINPQFALGTYHTVEGLLMMGFGLLLLQAECWVLDQLCQLKLSRPPARSFAVES